MVSAVSIENDFISLLIVLGNQGVEHLSMCSLTKDVSIPDGSKDSSENQSKSKADSTSEELNVICAKLCSQMKAQLVKSHDEVMDRYGGQAANFTADDLTQSPGEEEIDLQGLMARLSSSEDKGEPVKEDGDANDNTTTGAASGFYKTKGVSNYEISTALYGSKDEAGAASGTASAAETESAEHVGGRKPEMHT